MFFYKQFITVVALVSFATNLFAEIVYCPSAADFVKKVRKKTSDYKNQYYWDINDNPNWQLSSLFDQTNPLQVMDVFAPSATLKVVITPVTGPLCCYSFPGSKTIISFSYKIKNRQIDVSKLKKKFSLFPSFEPVYIFCDTTAGNPQRCPVPFKN